MGETKTAQRVAAAETRLSASPWLSSFSAARLLAATKAASVSIVPLTL
jgi:hypothetical protein